MGRPSPHYDSEGAMGIKAFAQRIGNASASNSPVDSEQSSAESERIKMLWALIERQQKVICQFDDDESAQREMLWSIVEHQQRKISALGGDSLQSTKLLLEVCAKHQANPRKRARIASPPRSSRNTKAHNFATPSPSNSISTFETP